MNVSHFFDHWGIAENPFRGEEARHDTVFARMSFVGGAGGSGGGSIGCVALGSVHSDFEKILGEMTRPSTSVVFGEKGSGKTAIRMQIEDRIARTTRGSRRADLRDQSTTIRGRSSRRSSIGEGGEGRAGAVPGVPARRAHGRGALARGGAIVVSALFKEGPDRPTVDLGRSR
jgi:hypothetical protein